MAYNRNSLDNINQIDPTTVANPITGEVIRGVFNGLHWTKDSAGTVVYAAPISGSANYIQASPASAQSANMWISGRIKGDKIEGAWGEIFTDLYVYGVIRPEGGWITSSSVAGLRVGTNVATPLYLMTNGIIRATIDGTTGAATFASSVTVNSATVSTSRTTGALIVTGGIGTSNDIYARSFYAQDGYGLGVGDFQIGGISASRLYVYNNTLGLDNITITPSTGLTTFNRAIQVNGIGYFNGSVSVTGVLDMKAVNSWRIASGNDSGAVPLANTTSLTFRNYDVALVPALTLSASGAATFSGSVTATAIIKSGGTSAQYLMADGSVTTNTTVLPYKVYTVLMQQSGTAAPTATIMQNTLEATITWSRFGTGQYIGTASTGVLTISKTVVIVTRPNPSATSFDTNVSGNPINTTTFAYSTFNNTDYLDSQSFGVFIEVRVYP